MQNYDLQEHDTSIFNSQNKDIKTAIKVIKESKEDLRKEWAKEQFDFVAKALEEKEAMN